MNKMNFFAIFAFLLFIFIGYRTYAQFKDIEQTEKIILLNESESLAGFVSAFRQTYQDIFIRNHINIDEKTIHLLPVVTISEISKRFSKNVNGDVVIRTVSDRPRNIKNMANKFELEQIKYFKDNPTKSDSFIHKDDAYNYTKPMFITALCMNCHGKREDTIPSIRDKYLTAYDYKIGDIRGLLNIKIKKREVFKTLYSDFFENLIWTVILYIIFLGIIYLLLQNMRDKEEDYTHRLEKEIENKTKEIGKQKDILLIQAYHDTLTNLPNRVLFKDRLNQAIVHARRYDCSIALFFIDIDYFKEINDSLGHHIGDRVLIEIAKRFKSQVHEDDTLARLGGDEFTLVMENLAHNDNPLLLAEKLQNVLTEAIIIDAHTFYITCSIGISLYPQDTEDTDSLLKYADTAMYKAKKEGRNNIQYYSSEMTQLALERLDIQTGLSQALKNDEFVMYYQPQIDTKTEKIIGLEALIRWNHPTKGFLLPAIFIDIAEETGIIVQIDRWVMKTAMKQICKWHEMGLAPGVLALNLTMRQLRSKDYLEVLSSTMKELDFNPTWLELEITESHVMKNPVETIKKLQAIHDMGVIISIDDFGTGYSSLAYLKRLPVNKVKIDQSFIVGIPEDKESVEIVKAIIALSNSLNLSIIAEGVETEEQRDALIEYGCENIQGYLYHKALCVKDMEEVLLTK